MSLIKDKYKLVKKIGKGSFSVVYKCVIPKEEDLVEDLIEEEKFAIKITMDDNKSNKYSERAILATTSFLPYIGKMITYFKYDKAWNTNLLVQRYRNGKNFKSCIVMDLYEMNLDRYVLENSDREGYKLKLCFQMLKALEAIHNRQIVHCDIKPANIAIRDSTFHLIDFSISTPDRENVWTHNTTTAPWRAPEIVKGRYCWNRAIDVWSLGVVLLQLELDHPEDPTVRYLPYPVEHWEYDESDTSEDRDRYLDELKALSEKVMEKAKDDEYYKILAQMLVFDHRNRTPAIRILDDPIFDPFLEDHAVALKEAESRRFEL